MFRSMLHPTMISTLLRRSITPSKHRNGTSLSWTRTFRSSSSSNTNNKSNTNRQVNSSSLLTHTKAAFTTATSAATATGAAAAVVLVLWNHDDQIKISGCSGIMGVVGKRCDASEILLNGLDILKRNQNYDSAGMATIQYDGQGKMSITKYGGDKKGSLPSSSLSSSDTSSDTTNEEDPIEKIRTDHESGRSRDAGHSVGIAHTRWATLGRVTDRNAHPHVDSSGRIALVHNGSLYNSHELRTWLERKGHVFAGDTDSEVMAKLIGEQKKTNQCTLKEAVEQALKLCEGTWGLAVISMDEPSKIILAKHGSPLWIGFSMSNDEQECIAFVSSDQDALLPYTNAVIPLDEGEIVELHPMGVHGTHQHDYSLEKIRLAQVFTPLDASKH